MRSRKRRFGFAAVEPGDWVDNRTPVAPAAPLAHPHGYDSAVQGRVFTVTVREPARNPLELTIIGSAARP